MAFKHTISVPFVGSQVSDILLWRDIKTSGGLFLAVTCFFAYFQFSPASPFVHLFQILATLAGVAFLAGQVFALMGRPGLPVPAIFKAGLSEEDARKISEVARTHVNLALATAAVLLSGKDMKLSLLVSGGSYLASVVFARIPILILAYSLFFLAFALPKAYEEKKNEVDKVFVLAKSKVVDAGAKFQESVMSKIPKAKKA